MVTIEDIKWGSYKEYEGPYFYGAEPYRFPDQATEADEMLLVLTTTEGGAYDAYNGYDSCICTSGLVQWCDRAPYFLVCRLLGFLAEQGEGLLAPISLLAQERGYVFQRSRQGGWRFFRGREEVRSVEQQRELYFGGASGLKGGFSDDEKVVAKRWAVAFADVWADPRAQKYQREYTTPKLWGFATSDARAILDQSRGSDGPYARTFRNAYISFAANNPRKAADALIAYVAGAGVRFDRDWVIGALKFLTYHPNVAIYPHRYDKIRPVLERLYGVDLPDLSKDLSTWSTVNNFQPEKHTPKGLQRALIKLGYDIGPSGADGLWGKRSAAALRTFEADAGLPKAFQDGIPDQYTVPALREKLEAAGEPFDFSS